MQTILHIRTRKDDPLSAEVIKEQTKQSQMTVKTFDLAQPQPNYDALLKEIFEADSVQVW